MFINILVEVIFLKFLHVDILVEIFFIYCLPSVTFDKHLIRKNKRANTLVNLLFKQAFEYKYGSFI